MGFSFVFWLINHCKVCQTAGPRTNEATNLGRWGKMTLPRPVRRKKPNLQGYGPPSEVPKFFTLQIFEVKKHWWNGNGGLKIPQRKWRIYDLWMKLKWKLWRELVKPCGLEEAEKWMRYCSRFCLWSSRVQVEGLAFCGAPCLLSQRELKMIIETDWNHWKIWMHRENPIFLSKL